MRQLLKTSVADMGGGGSWGPMELPFGLELVMGNGPNLQKSLQIDLEKSNVINKQATAITYIGIFFIKFHPRSF